MIHLNEGAIPTQPLPKGEGDFSIRRIVDEGYPRGGGVFEPTYLYLEIVPDSGSTTITSTVGSFTDVKTDDYFAEPVAWAVEKGITAGTSTTTFSPDAACTRGQIAAFLYRAFAK